VKHPRMWMECGVWPPPVRSQWRPSRPEIARRRRWCTACIVLAAALGATAGSVVTLALTGQVCP